MTDATTAVQEDSTVSNRLLKRIGAQFGRRSAAIAPQDAPAVEDVAAERKHFGRRRISMGMN